MLKKKKWCYFEKCSIQEFKVLTLKPKRLSGKKSRKWERLEKHKTLCPVLKVASTNGEVEGMWLKAKKKKKKKLCETVLSQWRGYSHCRKRSTGFIGPTSRNKLFSPTHVQNKRTSWVTGETSEAKQRLFTDRSWWFEMLSPKTFGWPLVYQIRLWNAQSKTCNGYFPVKEIVNEGKIINGIFMQMTKNNDHRKLFSPERTYSGFFIPFFSVLKKVGGRERWRPLHFLTQEREGECGRRQ